MAGKSDQSITNMKLVSVLVATLNNERTIANAVSSLLEQTYKNIQIIVVDDASTDRTAEILKQFGDSRLQVLSNSTTRGLAFSLNVAATIASGEYFARMDADDVAYPMRFEKQVGYLQAVPELEVLGTAVDCVLNDGKVVVMKRPQYHAELVAHIHRQNPFFHPSVIMRRRFFVRNSGYSVEMKRSQDYDLWLRGYEKSLFGNLQEPLVKYKMSSPRWKNTAYASCALLRAGLREKRLKLFFSSCRPQLAWLLQVLNGNNTQ